MRAFIFYILYMLFERLWLLYQFWFTVIYMNLFNIVDTEFTSGNEGPMELEEIMEIMRFKSLWFMSKVITSGCSKFYRHFVNFLMFHMKKMKPREKNTYIQKMPWVKPGAVSMSLDTDSCVFIPHSILGVSVLNWKISITPL